ncbi:MAG: peptidoglycan editing factor PgeF [Succinivibrio sp.]|jgi:YfiH family protein|nr:peptidoglycan editing factor PgeF [Succinivibrio sp.]
MRANTPMPEILERTDFLKGAAAGFTTRRGGVSSGPYASLNLGFHTGDDPAKVRQNRAILAASLGAEPVYMRQIHSSRVIAVDAPLKEEPECDGLVTATPGLPLAVMTADCLPLLLCAEDGRACAAVHCGWRGAAGGIVKAAVEKMREITPAPLRAFMGPCIGPESFEVGPEVREAFSSLRGSGEAFITARGDRLRCSLPKLAALALLRCGAAPDAVRWCGEDTYASPERFFSYRREHVTGRMVSVIALNPR